MVDHAGTGRDALEVGRRSPGGGLNGSGGSDAGQDLDRWSQVGVVGDDDHRVHPMDDRPLDRASGKVNIDTLLNESPAILLRQRSQLRRHDVGGLGLPCLCLQRHRRMADRIDARQGLPSMNLYTHQPAALATLVTRGKQLTQAKWAELTFVTWTHEPKRRPCLLVGVLPVDENGDIPHLIARPYQPARGACPPSTPRQGKGFKAGNPASPTRGRRGRVPAV